MKKHLAKILSEIFSYRNAALVVRCLARTSTCLRIRKFDIFGKIPDQSCVIVFRHSFKVFGKVADFYLIGAVSPRKVRGLFYPGLFQNDFCKPFLKQWGAIPANHLFHLHKLLGKNESIAIALDGLEANDNQSGFLGAAWIAQKTGLPMIPLRILSTGRSTRLEVKPGITVPGDADRDTLGKITAAVFRELTADR